MTDLFVNGRLRFKNSFDKKYAEYTSKYFPTITKYKEITAHTNNTVFSITEQLK